MLLFIIKSFYLVLPAYLANMAPVIFAKLGLLKFLDQPIDGGRKWGSQYVFGSSKTWRGIVSAVILATAIAGLQSWLMNYGYFNQISLLDYSAWWYVFGPLAGLGAILGDLVKSFFKRRLDIASGRPWPVFDNLDFIVGFFVFTWWLVWPQWPVVATVFLITLILHPLTNIVGYAIGFKKVWW